MAAVGIALVLGAVPLWRGILDPGRILLSVDTATVQEPWASVLPSQVETRPRNPDLADQGVFFYPLYRFVAESWLEGDPPLWNPWIYAGVPCLGNPQCGVLDPQVALLALLKALGGDLLFDFGFALTAWLRLFLAGLGAYALARRLGLARAGAALSGIGFAGSGFLLCWLNGSPGHVAPFLPWLLFFVEGLRCGNARSPAPAALILALAILGGHPETAFFTGATALAWSLRLLVEDAAAGRRALLALLLGTLLGAVSLVPFAEYLMHSGAWIARGVAASSRSLDPLALCAVLLAAVAFAFGRKRAQGVRARPIFFTVIFAAGAIALALVLIRRGLKPEATTAWIADWLGEPGSAGGYRGEGDYPEWAAAWVATPILLLALASAFTAQGPLRRRNLILSLGAIAWLLALRVPGIHDLFSLLPGIGLSATARLGAVSALMLSLLAGEGLQAATRPARLAAAGCGLAWMLACGFLPQRPPEPPASLPGPSFGEPAELADWMGFLRKPQGRVESESLELTGWVDPSLGVESMSVRFEEVAPSQSVARSYSAPLALSSSPPPGSEAATAPSSAVFFAASHLPVDRLGDGSWRVVVELYGKGLASEPVKLGERVAGVCTVERRGRLSKATLSFIALALLCVAASPPRLRWTILLLSLAQVLWFARGKNPAVPRAECFPATACERVVAREQGAHRFLADPGILPANTGLLRRLRCLDGYDAMDVASFNLFRPFALRPFTQALLGWNAAGVDLDSAAFRLLGARLLLKHERLEHPDYEWIAGPDASAPEFAEINVYRARNPMPRAFCVPRAVEREAVLADLASFDPARAVFLADGASWKAARAFETARTSDLRVSNNRVSVRVSLDGDGLLVLTDQAFPGWNARVDGVETPILTADSIFRAVPVGAGEHLVELSYAPGSLRLGSALTILAVLSLLVFWRR